MMELDVKKMSSLESYRLLTTLVTPRPIALVSSIDAEGRPNLSPYSFFNLFSSDPPIVIFSALRRIRDASEKDTLKNVLEVPEVVINIVTVEIAAQASLASSEFERGVDEFSKAGFTPLPAKKVRPFLVKEARAKLECRVIEVKPLGERGGAGNLVICEVIYIHSDEGDIHTVGRMGKEQYIHCMAPSLFSLPRPLKRSVGIDALPCWIKECPYLAPAQLALLASVEKVPERETGFTDERSETIGKLVKGKRRDFLLYEYIKEVIAAGEYDRAWQILYTLT